jgi:hypothetical protein
MPHVSGKTQQKTPALRAGVRVHIAKWKYPSCAQNHATAIFGRSLTTHITKGVGLSVQEGQIPFLTTEYNGIVALVKQVLS